MMTGFNAAFCLAIGLGLAGGSAAPALADDATIGPAGQVYELTFANVSPTYGGAIKFSFEEGGLIDTYTDSGIGQADQPGGSGDWDQYGDGVSISGDPSDYGYNEGDGMPPPPDLQLLAEGETGVNCDHWPQIEVGASADPSSLCWITNPHVLSVTRTQ
ncbi:hypothetical protein [Maricaulis sp.]|uniref:hypothetical protein n=1 Tax=Maricaulis sp. TaxID=1486257 RepID=UPI0025C19137|nr:hypothetical protein [Maricaulis sp.]